MTLIISQTTNFPKEFRFLSLTPFFVLAQALQFACKHSDNLQKQQHFIVWALNVSRMLLRKQILHTTEMVEDMLGETSFHSGHVTRNAERRKSRAAANKANLVSNFEVLYSFVQARREASQTHAEKQILKKSASVESQALCQLTKATAFYCFGVNVLERKWLKICQVKRVYILVT